jgi:rubrerythrin
MDNATIVQKLLSIEKVEHDAVMVYEAAINRVPNEDREIRYNLELFRNEHTRHAGDLLSIIRELGVTPPRFSQPVQNHAAEEMTAMKNTDGMRELLAIVQKHEHLTHTAYAAAIDCPDFPAYPDDIKAVLQHNYDDEQRHSLYINKALTRRPVA